MKSRINSNKREDKKDTFPVITVYVKDSFL